MLSRSLTLLILIYSNTGLKILKKLIWLKYSDIKVPNSQRIIKIEESSSENFDFRKIKEFWLEKNTYLGQKLSNIDIR